MDLEKTIGCSIHDLGQEPIRQDLTKADRALVAEFAERLKAYIAKTPAAEARDIHAAGSAYISKFVDQNSGIYSALMGTLEDYVTLLKLKHEMPINDKKVFELVRRNVNLYARIEELSEIANQATHAATHDAATGLYNKKYFSETLPREIEKAHISKEPLSLAIGDLNGFKAVNDLNGHPIGDYVLNEAIQYIATHLRKTDIFARVGGDESAIIFYGATETQAAQRCEEIREGLKSTLFHKDGNTFRLGITLGVKQAERDEIHYELIQRVDDCMYFGKELGKDCTVPWSLYLQADGPSALADLRNQRRRDETLRRRRSDSL